MQITKKSIIGFTQEEEKMEAKLINGKNYFNEESFKEMCKALEAGETIEVYIDCIGHTRNNMEQEQYKKHLEKKYGGLLVCTHCPGAYSYHYEYALKY